MHVERYAESMLPAITAAYNELTRGVPHCFPVDQATLAAVLRPPQLDEVLDEAIWVAFEGGEVVGFIHARVRIPRDLGGHLLAEADPIGALRFFAYRPSQRAAGQALLAAAEDYWRAHGLSVVVGFHYNDRYPFYHLPHVFLSLQLGHVIALLGSAGYAPDGIQLGLDWPDYVIDAPAPDDPALADPAGGALAIEDEWPGVPGAKPTLVVHARSGEREVGVSVWAGLDELGSAERDWVYTLWLGVDEAYRGRGLGRYLLRRGLYVLRQKGYRHASICVIGDNYRALQLYTNEGYRIIDWTHAWRKVLD